MVGLEPVETVQQVDLEVGPVEEVAQVEQVAPLWLVVQEVRLERLVVEVALVEVVGLGEQQVGLQEEGEQRVGRVQSSRTGTQGVCCFRQ